MPTYVVTALWLVFNRRSISLLRFLLGSIIPRSSSGVKTCAEYSPLVCFLKVSFGGTRVEIQKSPICPQQTLALLCFFCGPCCLAFFQHCSVMGKVLKQLEKIHETSLHDLFAFLPTSYAIFSAQSKFIVNLLI